MMSMWFCFLVLLVVCTSVKGECSYSINGTVQGTYGDSFTAYYYCCDQEDRVCTECCSFSLLWPTIIFSFIISLGATLMAAYAFYRYKKEQKKEEERTSLLNFDY